MTDITEYISGHFIGKLQVLDGRTKKDNIIAYVEGDDDIPFWSNILLPYTKYSFTVITNKGYKVAEMFPNGKTALLNIPNLDKDKIICIDADLDLIVKKYSKHSTRIKKSPYIINTEFYAIENVLSQPPLLKEVVTKVTGEMTQYDFAKFLKTFSCAISDLFYLYLACIKSKRKKFSLEDFKTYINFIKPNATNIDEFLSTYRNNYRMTLSNEFAIHKNSIIQYKRRLKEQGFKERDIYKLMQGHSLYNTIIRELLHHLCYKILGNKFDNIKTSNQTPDYCATKKLVYGFLDEYNKNLRTCIDYNFNQNEMVYNYLPNNLKKQLDSLYL